MKVLRRFLFFSVLAAGTLTLVLHGSVVGRVKTVKVGPPLKSRGNLIRIWTVGSPYTGVLPSDVVPPELQRRAKSLGYSIEIEAFRANGFAAKFREALQNHDEPEVLTFDNYGTVRGITTQTGYFEGIATDPLTAPSLVLVHEALASLQRRGWVMLVRSAVNHEAAMALSLRPPVCESESGPGAASPGLQSALQAVQEAAVSATRAYLACDQNTLSFISDDSRLGRWCFIPGSDTKVETVKACRVSGNANLSFVSLVSTFSAQSRSPVTNPELGYSDDVGQQSTVAVLRKQGDVWRLLTITDDPLATWARKPVTTNTIESLLDDGPGVSLPLEPARMSMPDGVRPLPAKGQRFGDLVWQPSQSKDVIGQLAEFRLTDDVVDRELTRLFFLSPSEDKISSGMLMSRTRVVWRVWSINKSGDVVFSEQRSYKNCR